MLLANVRTIPRTHLVAAGQRRSVLTPPVHRCISFVSPAHVAVLDEWIRADKRLTLADALHAEHLSDLYVTLPTRDGSLRSPEQPKEGTPLGYGHHLVFFHPRNPEHALRPDGTDQDFCPPEPWTRRMWAGGRMEWKGPLLVGQKATATSTISSVAKKGFEKGNPMVFVQQNITYRAEGNAAVAIEEERSHVYLAAPGNRRTTKTVPDLPVKADLYLRYLPSATTLFRFSALTFNGHYIHLDREYAQTSEGYPERLVHGPLTALMLLEAYATQWPSVAIKSFTYRAINPLIVNKPISIYGAEQGNATVYVWAEDAETKVVGMVGTITT